jgi:hypothetical protein
MKTLLMVLCLGLFCAEGYAQQAWGPANPVYPVSNYPVYNYGTTYYWENRPIVYYGGPVFVYPQYVQYVPVAPLYQYIFVPSYVVPATSIYPVPAAPKCRLFRY